MESNSVWAAVYVPNEATLYLTRTTVQDDTLSFESKYADQIPCDPVSITRKDTLDLHHALMGSPHSSRNWIFCQYKDFVHIVKAEQVNAIWSVPEKGPIFSVHISEMDQFKGLIKCLYIKGST